VIDGRSDDNVKITRSADPVFRVLVFYTGGSLYDLATNLHPPRDLCSPDIHTRTSEWKLIDSHP